METWYLWKYQAADTLSPKMLDFGEHWVSNYRVLIKFIGNEKIDITIQADYGIKDWLPTDEVIILINKSLVYTGDQIHLKLSHNRLWIAGGSDQRCRSQAKNSIQN